MTSEVAIVGGGLAGLGCAQFLRSKGIGVGVFEAEEHPGGKVQTIREDGYVVEMGPLGWLDKEPAVYKFVSGLSLTPLPAADIQNRRWLLKDGKLFLLPSGAVSFLASSVLSLSEKLRLFAEPFIPPRREGEESVFDFAQRRFGRGVAETFFGAMVSGIFGGDANALCVQAAFPLMAGWEFEAGSCVRGALRHMRKKKKMLRAGEIPKTSGALCSLPEGMAGLVEAAAQSLGGQYQAKRPVERIRRKGSGWELVFASGGKEEFFKVILATPAKVTAQILGEEFPQLEDAAEGIGGASLFVVTAAFSREQVDHPLDGFGFIALRHQGFRPLGVQYASSIFPQQTPKGKVQLRVLMGGAFDAEADVLTDQGLQEECLQPIRTMLGIHGEPEHVWLRRVEGGIPQYNMGHLERVGVFDAVQNANLGLYFVGDSLHGVGVNAVLKRAQKVADEVAENLQTQ